MAKETDQSIQDGILRTVGEGIKPFLKLAYFLAGPTMLWTTDKQLQKAIESEEKKTGKLERSQEDKVAHEEMGYVVLWGWVRVAGAIGIATVINREAGAVATAYFAADTLLTSLRRVGWGRIHGVYPK